MSLSKRATRTVFARAALICSFVSLALGAFAQAPITEEEFDNAWTAALASSEKRNRQVMATAETRSRGNLLSEDGHIEQFIPPDRLRFVDIVSSSGKTVRREFIEIGKAGFERHDYGPWVQYTVTNYSRGRSLKPDILPSPDLMEASAKCNSARVTLDGYLVTMISREWKRQLRAERESIWISADGLIVRTENLVVDEVAGPWIKRTVSVWDYAPPAFEIEAPIKIK